MRYFLAPISAFSAPTSLSCRTTFLDLFAGLKMENQAQIAHFYNRLASLTEVDMLGLLSLPAL